ncbi:DEKNAAC104786 [Brettanomyces naardenensis]|uniref:DEKNAAC104786 n=1 Tax=Brettanomyces naardenensis TaxID=13370 RepID=A0A448YRT4_BRENA|nr:DEKNAAC104786 [Brettanomyces naardenensis]
MSDTSLTGFGGFNVDTLKTLKIDNNRFLERIDSSVKEISGDLIIAANARNLKVSLPELKWVKTAMIKDTEEVNLDELQVVQSSAEFIENHFRDLKLPKLKSTGTTLSLIDNKRLERAEFPSLVEVGGGLMVINNDKLNQIDFFSQLKSVGGAIELEGDIDENKFKQLKVVKGSAIMKSSSNKFDCKDWVDNEVSSVVRGGKIECGSGDSEFTEVIHLDESGERTSRSTGRNSAKTSKNGSSIIDSSGVGGNSDMLSLGMALVVVAGIVIG